MQSASSSFTLPVTQNGKLLGVLTSYNSGDQISNVIAPEIVAKFLKDARDGTYEGFPSLGCSTQRTEDKSFRKYLKLSPDGGGLYISKVTEGAPAENAGIKEGDVLLSVDGSELDRRGYFQHPNYGPLPLDRDHPFRKNGRHRNQFEHSARRKDDGTNHDSRSAEEPPRPSTHQRLPSSVPNQRRSRFPGIVSILTYVPLVASGPPSPRSHFSTSWRNPKSTKKAAIAWYSSPA